LDFLLSKVQSTKRLGNFKYRVVRNKIQDVGDPGVGGKKHIFSSHHGRICPNNFLYSRIFFFKTTPRVSFFHTTTKLGTTSPEYRARAHAWTPFSPCFRAKIDETVDFFAIGRVLPTAQKTPQNTGKTPVSEKSADQRTGWPNQRTVRYRALISRLFQN